MKRFYLFAITMLVCMVTSCLTTIIGVVLPISTMQRIISAYILATSAGLVTLGLLVRATGHDLK